MYKKTEDERIYKGKIYMKVKLNKVQLILFPIILIVCLLSVGVALYMLFYNDADQVSAENSNLEDVTIQELREDFENLFENKLVDNGYNVSNINNKKNKDKDLVFTSYQKADRSEGKYNLNISIPSINIDDKNIEDINKEIVQIFQKKAENVLAGVEINSIYDVKYQAYINNGILSLVIQSTLKEGENAQRVIVKTYNYDIENAKVIKLEDAIAAKGLNDNEVANKIKEVIKEENDKAKALQSIGYTVYNRDMRSDMYDLEKSKNFFIGKNNYLYIVYAYGNTNYTNQIDLVII